MMVFTISVEEALKMWVGSIIHTLEPHFVLGNLSESVLSECTVEVNRDGFNTECSNRQEKLQ